MKVLLVGVGKLGYKLAEAMVAENIDVTLMDNDPRVLERITEHMDVLSVVGNGIDLRILEEIGINEYDLLVACTDNDETNTVICTLGKKLGCTKTIARIRNPEYMEQLDFIKEEMGIDYIVNPDLATAKAMEKYLLKSYSFYFDEFASGKVQVIDFNIGHEVDIVGKELKNLEGFENLLIAAVSTEDGIVIPSGSTKLKTNDVIHIIGKNEDIKNLSMRYGFNTVDKKVENVIILGGSNIGYYLARNLSKQKISVRLIEKDRERAEELSNDLDDVIVIHGDGTDINILEEEMLEEMDAFVGVTGLDEQNILMGLMAKQEGVTKAIAKISRPNYNKLIDRLDIDAALNPIYITASNILKIVRGGKVVSVSLLLGGEAEVTELIVHNDSPFINIALEKLKLPEGIIIGAILRDGEVIIPKGDTKLKVHDRIVVFSLSEDLEVLKMFFAPHKGGILSGLWNRAKGNR